MARITGIFLFLLACGLLPAAENPSAAVAAFLEALKNGKTELADNPAVTVSPFCPDGKKKRFEEGLVELAGQLGDATALAEEVVPARDIFSGYRIVLRQKRNPLQVAVRPVCVIRTGEGWKVAAGLSHFDNTNFGFDPKLRETATQVAEATRRDAEEAGKLLLSQGAQTLWKEIRERRATWPDDGNDPDVHVRRFLEYDRQQDAIGKLACFHVTPDLPPDKLERFLALLGEETFGSAETGEAQDEGEVVEELGEEERGGRDAKGEVVPAAQPEAAVDLNFPLSVLLEGKAEGEKICRVFGFIHPEDPSDYYTMGFYLRKGEGNRWLIVPNGYDVEGLRSPDSDLMEWYEDNETRFAKLLVRRLAEDARKNAPPPAGRDEGAAVLALYLDALGRRSIPEILGLLDLPDDALVDDYDGLLEELGRECWRFAPPGSNPPQVIPMRWKEQGEFGGAVQAIYQPAATRPFVLHAQLARWTPEGWRVLPPPWEGAPESLTHRPEARKLQTMLEDGWEAQKKEAVGKIFSKSIGTPENGRDAETTVKEAVTKAMAAAAAGEFENFLGYWESPLDRPVPVAALETTTRMGWEIHKSGQAPEPEAIMVRGNLAGVMIPVQQAKREDGQKPARMLLLRRKDQVWFLVPGAELFRPVNRGFKALNQQALRDLKKEFDADSRQELDDLRSWVEQSASPP